MQDMSQVRYITRYYSHLQGLKIVPMGFCFIMTGVANHWWLPHLTRGESLSTWMLATLPSRLVLLVVGTAAVLLKPVIGRYYARNFGITRKRGKERFWDTLLEAASGVVLLIAFWLDWFVRLPVSTIGLFFAAYLLIGWFASLSRRKHWIVLIAAITGMSLAPLTGLVSELSIFGPKALIGFVTCGLAMVAGGLLDHRILMRSLPPAPLGGEYAGAV